MRTIEQVQAEIAQVKAVYAAANAAAKKQKRVDAVVNEGGDGYSSAEVMSERAFDQYVKDVTPLEQELFALIWTLDVTVQRRAAWNAQVVKCKSHADMSALQKRLGYGPNDIVKAKALHGIK